MGLGNQFEMGLTRNALTRNVFNPKCPNSKWPVFMPLISCLFFMFARGACHFYTIYRGKSMLCVKPVVKRMRMARSARIHKQRHEKSAISSSGHFEFVHLELKTFRKKSFRVNIISSYVHRPDNLLGTSP